MTKPAILCDADILIDQDPDMALVEKLIAFKNQGADIYITTDKDREQAEDHRLIFKGLAKEIFDRATFNMYKNSKEYCLRSEARTARNAMQLIFIDKDTKLLSFAKNNHAHCINANGITGTEMADMLQTIYSKICPK